MKYLHANILSKKDVNNYQKIFVSQENCEWKKANRDILKIKNKILIGHVFSTKISSSSLL